AWTPPKRAAPPGPDPHPVCPLPGSSMGSVSSLISGHSFHSKHCRASQYKLRKSSHLKKLNRYSDGLLRFGFSQDSSHKSGSKSSKNEDFFYIKVSQKGTRLSPPGLHLASPAGSWAAKLAPACSGGLSDSGRNSMSSLSTPSSPPWGPSAASGARPCPSPTGATRSSTPAKPPATTPAEKTTCIRSPISTDESTIQELEQKLLEREGELQELQLSFEEKEISSCQAYEEKQRRCKEELEGLKQKCNSKLKQTSQKTQRTQQVLHLQVFQLQQEKKQLREELENLMKEQNLLETKLRSYEKEKTSFAPALEETQWEVCQKSGEISLLKQQLKEPRTWRAPCAPKAMELEVCENELQRKKNESELLREKVNLLEQEIVDLRTELAVLKEQLSEARDGARPCPAMADDAQALQGEVERLRAELKAERDNNEQMTSGFQHERQTWKEEKEKVIHYQKQLQQSYLHMYKRNQNLEKMLQQLAAGEDGKEPIELDIPGADVPYEDIIATEI
uniref:Leucine zipper tumor suppressor 1 n=1 Tax=Anas platyrhynchos TaxID=8839 RepID=A0A8B9SVS2_ANAPL